MNSNWSQIKHFDNDEEFEIENKLLRSLEVKNIFI